MLERVRRWPGPRLRRIVSGGQTGADRGGLDAAIDLGIAHGGWCPKGRRAEDGAIPARYLLRETASPRYEVRTRQNVRDSDATVVFTRGALTGGSALTVRTAAQLDKPVLHVDLARTPIAHAARRLRRFLCDHPIEVLNVAGSRESTSPGIGALVPRILVRALGSRREASDVQTRPAAVQSARKASKSA